MQRFLLLYLGIELARKQAPQLRPMRLWFALASLRLSRGVSFCCTFLSCPTNCTQKYNSHGISEGSLSVCWGLQHGCAWTRPLHRLQSSDFPLWLAPRSLRGSIGVWQVDESYGRHPLSRDGNNTGAPLSGMCHSCSILGDSPTNERFQQASNPGLVLGSGRQGEAGLLLVGG